MLHWTMAAILSVMSAGCANFSYYLQSADGQLRVLHARRPITEVVADPATPPALKARLELALRLRDFASAELKLPDNGSYRNYADLHRPYIVWNVFAAPEFSVTPKRWCFLIAGCVGYRGYFSRDNAEEFAAGLRAEGYDAFVSGVPAYSTLGWFDDPVLNTFINYPEYELARLLFHELAHQRVYAKNDSQFNESFAVTVETVGVERWIAERGEPAMKQAFDTAQMRRTGFLALIHEYREKLRALYQKPLAPDEMRKRKAETFAQMREAYADLKTRWNGFSGYDRFFADLNNAQLASVAIYTGLVPQFQQLLARCGGDLSLFYKEVEKLAALPRDERDAVLGVAKDAGADDE